MDAQLNADPPIAAELSGTNAVHPPYSNPSFTPSAHPYLSDSPPPPPHLQVFLAVDAQLHKDPSIDAELSGTTAVVCLMRWTKGGKGTAWVANAGDSRAVLGVREAGRLKAVPLSEDQKPDTPAEYKRITKRGGFVSPPEYEWGGPARVWLDSNMSLPGLAMGRSIGDHLVRLLSPLRSVDPALGPAHRRAATGLPHNDQSDFAADRLITCTPEYSTLFHPLPLRFPSQVGAIGDFAEPELTLSPSPVPFPLLELCAGCALTSPPQFHSVSGRRHRRHCGARGCRDGYLPRFRPN